MHTFRKRLVAAVINVAAPGAGYYHLGAARSAIVFASVLVFAYLISVFAAAHGSPALFLAGVGLLLTSVVQLLRTLSGQPPKPVRVAAGAVLSLAAASLLGHGHTYVVEAFHVPGKGMYPNFLPGDHVFVTKWRSPIKHGQVVAVRWPEEADLHLKRAVAFSGDTVELKDDALWINGRQLPRARLTEPCVVDAPCELWTENNNATTYRLASSSVGVGDLFSTVAPYTVRPRHVYLLGDARDWSLDSRDRGTVSAEDIVGRVTFVWWPPSRFSIQAN